MLWGRILTFLNKIIIIIKTLKILKCSLAGSVFPDIRVLLTGMTEINVLLTLILQVETMHYAFSLEVQVTSNALSFLFK